MQDFTLKTLEPELIWPRDECRKIFVQQVAESLAADVFGYRQDF